jgi:DNA gyrase inhibitor GyrI
MLCKRSRRIIMTQTIENKTTLNVRIETLPAMRVASALGFGTEPEYQSWTKLTRWMEANNILSDGAPHRYFGFNNPDPSPASPNYGYEQWVTVGPEASGDDEVKVFDYAGGQFAVTRCVLRDITPAWMQLVAWVEQSPYAFAKGQCLEEFLGEGRPDLDKAFDLFLPVVKR